ncbi:MAG: hypothetical protein A3I89_00315 [Candidatus Harrisonbacteria bacterium RIFCSPLOWO2_02_FULL_41_11]|uniref:Uncharacterized protein n=1 Tax=Candidatus Harrisonbacteria bacterium RIFCSPHIGHO2_02_FULL_42_16 TaxID=1798404 RepID=A0A1G1ZI32_9BACT|nr:MAG: hypothetical protein A3B92_03070 [Candidatus Harrisonbacteria bacterium RIFCSPHIGHO2_02_FULL_42_16]OGY65799.1 MAG: hypothetical protein A3I89_00315 [Candidatus Harrisonbacteria bacterium RIFCSPLOWO2_02_FULL_41_11]
MKIKYKLCFDPKLQKKYANKWLALVPFKNQSHKYEYEIVDHDKDFALLKKRVDGLMRDNPKSEKLRYLSCQIYFNMYPLRGIKYTPK